MTERVKRKIDEKSSNFLDKILQAKKLLSILRMLGEFISEFIGERCSLWNFSKKSDFSLKRRENFPKKFFKQKLFSKTLGTQENYLQNFYTSTVLSGIFRSSTLSRFLGKREIGKITQTKASTGNVFCRYDSVHDPLASCKVQVVN